MSRSRLVHFCCFCYERRARLNALKVAFVHVGQANLHRISIRVGVDDPHLVRDALSRGVRVDAEHAQRVLAASPWREHYRIPQTVIRRYTASRPPR